MICLHELAGSSSFTAICLAQISVPSARRCHTCVCAYHVTRSQSQCLKSSAKMRWAAVASYTAHMFQASPLISTKLGGWPDINIENCEMTLQVIIQGPCSSTWVQLPCRVSTPLAMFRMCTLAHPLQTSKTALTFFSLIKGLGWTSGQNHPRKRDLVPFASENLAAKISSAFMLACSLPHGRKVT